MKAYIEYIQCIILHIVYLITLGILFYCFSAFPGIVNTILNYQNRSAFTIFCSLSIDLCLHIFSQGLGAWVGEALQHICHVFIFIRILTLRTALSNM